jgi:glycosyltransferase involved in cell wall biosynthesis
MVQTSSDYSPLGAGNLVPVPILSTPVLATQAVEVSSTKTNKPAQPQLSVAMITPWKQECGNAEYAERLCVALNQFAKVLPFDLRNFAEDFEMRSKAKVRTYFSDLIARINNAGSDVVHIQHEFCFFGRSIQRSNRQFLSFVQKIKKPIVVTLHTWLDPETKRSNRPKAIKSFLKNPLDAIRCSLHRKCLYKALCECDSIVVHTHDTFTMLVSAYPKLRQKVSIVQIPVSQVETSSECPPVTKAPKDIWIVLPGFVSPYKGHLHAVNALCLLPSNYKLVIAGGRHPKDRGAPRYWMELLKTIEELGLQDRVIFTGFLKSGSEQATVLKQADLFLLPYEEVGQSGSAVLADALAYDKPVVTSRARSMFAYRMSQDSVFSSTSIDVTDPEVLSESILSVLEDESDESQMASHRKAAISRYSLSSIGSVYERLYKEVRSKAVC